MRWFVGCSLGWMLVGCGGDASKESTASSPDIAAPSPPALTTATALPVDGIVAEQAAPYAGCTATAEAGDPSFDTEIWYDAYGWMVWFDADYYTESVHYDRAEGMVVGATVAWEQPASGYGPCDEDFVAGTREVTYDEHQYVVHEAEVQVDRCGDTHTFDRVHDLVYEEGLLTERTATERNQVVVERYDECGLRTNWRLTNERGNTLSEQFENTYEPGSCLPQRVKSAGYSMLFEDGRIVADFVGNQQVFSYTYSCP